jgi:hypothetical protein
MLGSSVASRKLYAHLSNACALLQEGASHPQHVSCQVLLQQLPDLTT